MQSRRVGEHYQPASHEQRGDRIAVAPDKSSEIQKQQHDSRSQKRIRKRRCGKKKHRADYLTDCAPELLHLHQLSYRRDNSADHRKMKSAQRQKMRNSRTRHIASQDSESALVRQQQRPDHSGRIAVRESTDRRADGGTQLCDGDLRRILRSGFDHLGDRFAGKSDAVSRKLEPVYADVGHNLIEPDESDRAGNLISDRERVSLIAEQKPGRKRAFAVNRPERDLIGSIPVRLISHIGYHRVKTKLGPICRTAFEPGNIEIIERDRGKQL